MPAAKPEKTNDIAGVLSELKRDAQNISFNLDLGGFDIIDGKGKVVKTIVPEKGLDAIYVINRSSVDPDVEQSGEFLAKKRQDSVVSSSNVETAFAETQDDLLKAVDRWNATTPGASKVASAIEVGRLQRELATLERRLRDTQYKYREVLPFPALRRLYSPLSMDDRGMPFSVYKLSQTLNLAKERTIPVSK
jgi:hypothetical protein